MFYLVELFTGAARLTQQERVGADHLVVGSRADMREAARGQLSMRAEDVERAIDAALCRRPLLESHRRGARSVSAFLSMIAAVRLVLYMRPGTHVSAMSFVTEFVLILGAVGAAVHARRVTYQLQTIGQLLLTLRFLRNVLEQQPAQNVFIVEPVDEVASPGDRSARWTAPELLRRTCSRVVTATRNLPWSRLAGAAGLTAAILAVTVVVRSRGPATSTSHTWNFEETSNDPKVLGFRLSSSETGEWLLADYEGATGNRALVNRAGDPAATPASAVVNDSMTRDLKASTRCKAAVDRSHQACGLVFRYVNDANYYVARFDAVRSAVMIGVVVGGVERELRSATAQASLTAWQEVAVVAQADYLLVSLNGQHALSVHDPTLPGAGRVGMWAPPDGEAYFDELSFSSLPATLVHPSDLLPFLLRRKT